MPVATIITIFSVRLYRAAFSATRFPGSQHQCSTMSGGGVAAACPRTTVPPPFSAAASGPTGHAINTELGHGNIVTGCETLKALHHRHVHPQVAFPKSADLHCRRFLTVVASECSQEIAVAAPVPTPFPLQATCGRSSLFTSRSWKPFLVNGGEIARTPPDGPPSFTSHTTGRQNRRAHTQAPFVQVQCAV